MNLLLPLTASQAMLPEWGWGAILFALGVLFSVIAYLLKRRDDAISNALKDLNSKLDERTSGLPRLWERVKNLKDREPTMPTSIEEVLRQLQESRVEHGMAVDQLKAEISAVDRKQIERANKLSERVEKLKEKLWNQVSECGEKFVKSLDYKEKVNQLAELLDELRTIATRLDQKMENRSGPNKK